MINFEAYEKYVFIFAHPDDEIFTAVTICNLIRKGKAVYAIYITNGDFLGAEMGKTRVQELANSMSMLGVKPENFTMLNFSESPLIDYADKVIHAVLQKIRAINPDCIVGHDYEGRHIGHDLASFCAYLSATKLGADFWVFPAYNGLGSKRRWNHLLNNKSVDYEMRLEKNDQNIKQSVVEAHASQKEYFETILASSDAKDFLEREILHQTRKELDYRIKPTEPIKYIPAGNFEIMLSVVKRNLEKYSLLSRSK